MVGTFDLFVKSCSLMVTHVVESKECFEKATRACQNVCEANRSAVGVPYNADAWMANGDASEIPRDDVHQLVVDSIKH